MTKRSSPPGNPSRLAVPVSDPWGWDCPHLMADICHEQERDTHSRLLGPDGQPLRYERLKMGFDLRPRSKT